ncbi:hypothetical protein RRG08_009428 [Elysia crispata]|uniref:Uncharacterized protein n=1 Tax=Elysia crispata TaxID=231223 RepID=A0AAE0Y8L1_9GAST|nr:hypothetical protein RRG08_009428 [Elysia crispata]
MKLLVISSKVIRVHGGRFLRSGPAKLVQRIPVVRAPPTRERVTAVPREDTDETHACLSIGCERAGLRGERQKMNSQSEASTCMERF